MVLQELGGKLTAALKKLQSCPVVDAELVEEILKDISRALIEGDVNVKMVAKLKKNVASKIGAMESTASSVNKRRLIQMAVMDELISMVDGGKKAYTMKKGKSNVVMFVGLQGSGKTTTIAKFAHFYQRKGWKVAMVCADTFRAGAFDQLKQNATKLRCPYYGSYTEADPVRIAEEGAEQFRKERYEVIIVDTSGRHKQEDALFDEMQDIQAAVQPDNIVFVMDATQGQSIGDQANAFGQAVDVGSVVITKLDGHAKGGGALSAVAATKSPIIFLGSGEHFDDFEMFEAESFVRGLLGFSDMKGILRELRENPETDPKQMLERMSKGQLTLRDMYGQFRNLMKMGPMGNIMGSMGGGMPGIPAGLIPPGQEEQGVGRIKRFMYMMDSMTDDELDGKVVLENCPTRIRRIARGSGTMEEEVTALLHWAKVIGKMGKASAKGGMPPMNAANAQKFKQMQKNPALAAQNLGKMMDANTLKKMGGAAGLQKLMEGGGGAESMEAMQQMMSGGGGADFMKKLGGAMPPGMMPPPR